MEYVKLSAFNPIKLFAYCFVLRSQIQSKRALELLNMPQTKSGKQFSVLSKGRQIYQQYEYTKSQCMPEDARELGVQTKDLIPSS